MDEYQIVELVKDRYRRGLIKANDNFLLNDTSIISKKSYEHSYEHNQSISKQVIGYVNNDTNSFVCNLEFPLLRWDFISSAYLYKKGYLITGYNWFGPAPLPNLKYIIHCIMSDMEDISNTPYEFQDRLVIELVDLDVAANNLNLPNIVSTVLGTKLISETKMIKYNEFYKINEQMRNQKLFAGHAWDDAHDIVSRYFDQNERELLKEVLKISQAYERVFRSYRVVYDTKTWEQVLV